MEEERIKLKQIEEKLADIDFKINQLTHMKNKLMEEQQELKASHNLRKRLLTCQRDWSEENFAWSELLRTTLRTKFEIPEIRPYQLKAINALLSKKDVILLAPTGGGKSLCYQLPALLVSGITLVISPLISLMMDQCWTMENYGITCHALNSYTDKTLTKHIYDVLRNMNDYDSVKLIYVTPEQLTKNKRFMAALQRCYQTGKLNFIAIDEVHCVSQWGHDFRPDYKHLSILKQLFPNTKILGVTATATASIISDVQRILNLDDCVTITAPFHRPNLYYHVLLKPEPKKLLQLIKNLLSERFKNQSGIIYTLTIKEAEDLVTELKTLGLKALLYHGTMASPLKMGNHVKWLSGTCQVIVATIAFGMGIDKPDVRFVIHYSMSKNMFGYYQESGRAGRDGKRAECILFYSSKDHFKINSMVLHEYQGLKNTMINYCLFEGTTCRRAIFAKEFEYLESNDLNCNKMCDNCINEGNKTGVIELDITEHCNVLRSLISQAENLKSKLTPNMLMTSWYGKSVGQIKIVPNRDPPPFERFIGEQILIYLVSSGYLKEDIQYTSYKTLVYIKLGTLRIPDDGIKFKGICKFSNLPLLTSEQNQNCDINGEEITEISEDLPPPIKRLKTSTKSKATVKIVQCEQNPSDDDCIVVTDSVDVFEILDSD